MSRDCKYSGIFPLTYVSERTFYTEAVLENQFNAVNIQYGIYKEKSDYRYERKQKGYSYFDTIFVFCTLKNTPLPFLIAHWG